ncbi:MAG: EF2563 family selenium-dependent molybdenum hydroxylase system protein [Desulfobacterales bacterium]|nr:EF2563 family selenium-dependent molybdenum hydroxylase system protein [Desulfobacterales bacterium]
MDNNVQRPLRDLTIAIKGAGEIATGVAWRLFQANLCKLFMMDVDQPLAVRRQVSFCEAIHEGSKTVENVTAVNVNSADEFKKVWTGKNIPVLADPKWESIGRIMPDVVVDAIIAKQNLGTSVNEAALVIGLGPAFIAPDEVHMIVETNRGHNLGRILLEGSAEPNTGIPGSIGGYTVERVLRAPAEGVFVSYKMIGHRVATGDVIGVVNDTPVMARIDGVIRGMIKSGIIVSKGLKIGDIDPRGEISYCDTISEKARAIGGSVLEAILRKFN